MLLDGNGRPGQVGEQVSFRVSRIARIARGCLVRRYFTGVVALRGVTLLWLSRVDTSLISKTGSQARRCSISGSRAGRLLPMATELHTSQERSATGFADRRRGKSDSAIYEGNHVPEWRWPQMCGGLDASILIATQFFQILVVHEYANESKCPDHAHMNMDVIFPLPEEKNECDVDGD